MNTIEKNTVATEMASALAGLAAADMLTETSFNLSDPNITYETWLALGEAFGRLRKASSWWIGDWFIFGDYRWGEKAAAAEHLAGVSPHRLAAICRTCMYVPKSRRRLSLPFSYHTEVSRLMPEEQTRFLTLAEDNGWTRDQLRRSILESQRRFPEVTPQWEGAVVLRRQQDVEDVARLIYAGATPVGDSHYQIERGLYEQLAAALGEEK